MEILRIAADTRARLPSKLNLVPSLVIMMVSILDFRFDPMIPAMHSELEDM